MPSQVTVCEPCEYYVVYAVCSDHWCQHPSHTGMWRERRICYDNEIPKQPDWCPLITNRINDDTASM